MTHTQELLLNFTGVPVALMSVEAGAKTVLLEKKASFTAFGPNWFGGVNSRYTKALGVELDRTEIVGDLMRYASWRANMDLINLWFDRSGEAIDWFGNELDECGTLEFAVETDTKDTHGRFLSPIISHVPVKKPYIEMGQNQMGTVLTQPVMMQKAVRLSRRRLGPQRMGHEQRPRHRDRHVDGQ